MFAVVYVCFLEVKGILKCTDTVQNALTVESLMAETVGETVLYNHWF